MDKIEFTLCIILTNHIVKKCLSNMSFLLSVVAVKFVLRWTFTMVRKCREKAIITDLGSKCGPFASQK